MRDSTASDATSPATKPFVVPREAIEVLRSVVVEGRTVEVGEVRDFRRHPALAAFLPESARPSIAWTRLAPAQTHHAHVHPVASMILICSGSGRVIGDVAGPVSAGDAVCVPAGAKHGFVAGDEEMNCLSLQFEGAGLFEDANAPRLSYVDDASARYARLQDEWRRRWRTLVVDAINPLLADAAAAERFWSYLKGWSMRFQRLLFVRQSSIGFADPTYELFRRHLGEELDHDAMIAAEPAPWDAELDACEHWFEGEVSARTPVEKLIIVNGVLEAAGAIFGGELRGVAPDMKAFVELHGERDAAHAEMGADLIAAYVASHADAALTIAERSWRMFVAMFERIVTLSK